VGRLAGAAVRHDPRPCLRPAELVERLRALEARHRGRLALEEVGRSVQGRFIHLVTLGTGPRHVLLWSQMHGDEPSATPALLDIADTLLGSSTSEARAILDGLTLLMVPMLNPDGAERYRRRNAQAIDVNRDALHLTTPEGRVLKAVRDRFRPELGFNLHDQNRRTTVGDTGVLATISLLAVSGDREGTLTPGRARAKRVCSAVARVLEPFVPGGIAATTRTGTRGPSATTSRPGARRSSWSRAGASPRAAPLTDLTRLNYVALLTALHGLARDDLAGETAELYEGLKRNDDGYWTDVLLAGGRLWQPGGGEPYRADVAFDLLDDDPLVATCAEPGWQGASRVREVGDGRLLGSARRLDVTGRLLAPAFTASVRGVAAQSWLTADVLVAVGRLGVARLRWHVAPVERPEAVEHADRVASPGRPSDRRGGRRRSGELAGDRLPARLARVGALESALDALTRGSWRERAAGRPLAELLGRPRRGTPELLSPRGPGRPRLPRRPAPARGGRPRRGRLELEAVFLDGREPGAAR
jgi:hypothetical protein